MWTHCCVVLIAVWHVQIQLHTKRLLFYVDNQLRHNLIILCHLLRLRWGSKYHDVLPEPVIIMRWQESLQECVMRLCPDEGYLLCGCMVVVLVVSMLVIHKYINVPKQSKTSFFVDRGKCFNTILSMTAFLTESVQYYSGWVFFFLGGGCPSTKTCRLEKSLNIYSTVKRISHIKSINLISHLDNVHP